MTSTISDEILGAYLDEELDADERNALIEDIAGNDDLRRRACEMWQVKQMVRGAYPLPRQKSALAGRRPPRAHWLQALAASVLLLVGSLGGWIANDRLVSDDERLLTSQIDTIRAEGGRVVLHLFSDEPVRIEAALRTADRLANSRDRSGRPFRVEFLANGPGLHLLRSGGTPYASRVAALHNYENVKLVACHEAMERMRERGLDVTLLPGVEEAVSAESEMAERLTQGWRYIQS
jgi:intracellular sulfur oxidation DsrE/DsrF family protein